MKSRIASAIGAAVLVAVSGSAALAATQTSQFVVAATVPKNCLVSSTNLNFGTYTPAAGDVTGSSTVTVRCTAGTTFDVALSAGQELSFAPRKMQDASFNELEYNLFTSNAYTTVWGDATGATVKQNGVGGGMGVPQAVAYTVYGRLPDNAANQLSPESNSYADTITVTVTY
jgi:spore coat protein U-like protein